MAAPSGPLRSFIAHAQARHGLTACDPAALHDWSCRSAPDFWGALVSWLDLPVEGSAEPAMTGDGVAGARFFPNLRLNAAQWLLHDREAAHETSPALILRDESGRREARSRAGLRERAMRIAAGLRAAGVQPGDRVVAIGRNSIELVEAFLGTVAIGAIWSSVGPDLGAQSVLARFGQLSPTAIFVDEHYTHHGLRHELGAHLKAVLRELPSVRTVVRLHPEGPADALPASAVTLEQLAAGAGLDFASLPRLPFDHPMLVLFTSGTTGRPKCLLHGAGGTLLEHLKEHRLHGGYGPQERLLFITSAGWMMWNWAVGGLASAMPLVFYDGSVSYPDADALVRVLAEERITVFGAGPAYFQMLEHLQREPAAGADLAALHTVLSTGSVLHERQFDWITTAFGGVRIESVSGGTDIVGCFVLGHPDMPQVRGDSTGPGLGMALRVVRDGRVERTGEGDLVCVSPFPSRPVAIWGDASGERLQDSYYRANPGCWTHGDRALIRENGSIRILGRSDGVLNIRGVRIGPAEVQSIATTVPGVREAMAAGQPDPDEPGGERLVLFLVLEDGLSLDRPLILAIKRAIRDAASPVHVPSRVHALAELPVTHSGKLAEAAVRAALRGEPVANAEALRNPHALEPIAALGRTS